MAPRLELQQIFTDILGSSNVYFQPPQSVTMQYPCIIYKRDYRKTQFADDKPYADRVRYQVTIITRDPDSDIPDKVALLPMCVYDRFYTADNLNHDVFNLYH
jgi:hypothetical protein